MKPKTLLLLGAALLSQLGLAQEAVPGEILVKFHTDRPVDQAAAHAPTRAHKVGEVPNLKVQLLRLPAGISTRAALDYYRSLPGVEYAEPNYIAHAQFTPNDISFNSQWGPKKIQAPQAWEVIQGSPDVIVAILDTGVDLSHPDLLPKLTIGWDFVNNDAWADDDHGHGTHCAGIAAAGTNNAIGVAGIGFNSRIMPVKVLGSNGSGSYAYIVAGIRYAADNGAKVISLSLGGQSTSYALEDAVNYAWSKGAIVVAAAGNANSTTPHYPAAYTNAIAVGASESNDARASYSNYGSWVDVAAPGSSILSTTRGGGYGYMSGTSMATPHVAGQAALVWSHYGASTSVSMIRQRIEGHTDPIGSWIKYGRVNVYKSIGAPPSDPPPSGDGRTEYAPTVLTMNWATLVGGNVNSLDKADNVYADIDSRLSNTRHVVEWQAETRVNTSGTLKSLEIDLEAQQSQNLTAFGYLYNWSTAKWDMVGQIALSGGDARVKWTRNTPAAYVSNDGLIRLKLWTGNSTTASFRQRVDQVLFTTVTEGGTEGGGGGGGGGGTPPPSGGTNDHAPTALTMNWATLVGGNVSSLATVDGNYAVIDSRQSNTRHVIEWQSETKVNLVGTLTRIDVEIRANQNQSLSGFGYLFNFATNKWDMIGSISLTGADATAKWSRTSPSAYVSSTGVILFKLWTGNNSLSPFRQNVDLVKFTTVTQ